MSGFEEYLKSIGFAPFKLVYENRKYEMVPLTGKELGSFSTMVPGRLDNRWLKDGKEIIFGLHKEGKPPTLVYPRPAGVVSDDIMNQLLKEKTPEEIYNLIQF